MTTKAPTPGVSAAVDKYVDVRATRLKLDKQSALLKEEEEKLKAGLIEFMLTNQQSVVASEHTALTLNTRLTPTAEDWEAIQKYVAENEAFDLLTHKLSAPAIVARWEAGEEIPGVGRFMVKTLSVSKLTKG
jgi:hypothetical protein